MKVKCGCHYVVTNSSPSLSGARIEMKDSACIATELVEALENIREEARKAVRFNWDKEQFLRALAGYMQGVHPEFDKAFELISRARKA